MKKRQAKHRTLRKCERGVKTKSFNKGCRYVNTLNGLQPVMWCNSNVDFMDYARFTD